MICCCTAETAEEVFSSAGKVLDLVNCHIVSSMTTIDGIHKQLFIHNQTDLVSEFKLLP